MSRQPRKGDVYRVKDTVSSYQLGSCNLNAGDIVAFEKLCEDSKLDASRGLPNYWWKVLLNSATGWERHRGNATRFVDPAYCQLVGSAPAVRRRFLDRSGPPATSLAGDRVESGNGPSSERYVQRAQVEHDVSNDNDLDGNNPVFARKGDTVTVVKGSRQAKACLVRAKNGVEQLVVTEQLTFLSPAQTAGTESLRIITQQPQATQQNPAGSLPFPMQVQLQGDVSPSCNHPGYVLARHGDYVTVTSSAGSGHYNCTVEATGHSGMVPAQAVGLSLKHALPGTSVPSVAGSVTSDRDADVIHTSEGSYGLLGHLLGNSVKALVVGFKAKLESFRHTGDVTVADVHDTLAKTQLDCADLRQVCEMTAKYLRESDNFLACMKLAAIVFLEVHRYTATTGLLSSSEYRSLVFEANEVAYNLPAEFEKSILGNDKHQPSSTTVQLKACLDGDESRLRDVITTLMAQFHEGNVNIIAMLIAMDLWMSDLYNWSGSGRWSSYFRTLHVNARRKLKRHDVILFLRSFQMRGYFSIDMDANAFLECIGALYFNQSPVDCQTAEIVWKNMVDMGFHSVKSNVKRFLENINGKHYYPWHSTHRTIVIHLLGYAARARHICHDVAVVFFHSMQLGQDFPNAVACAEKAAQSLVGDSDEVGLSTISSALLDFCAESKMKPSIAELIQSFTGGRHSRGTTATNIGGDMAMAYLTGDGRLLVQDPSQHGQKADQVKQIAAVVAHCPTGLLSGDCFSVLAAVHIKLGSNLVKTAQVLNKCDYLAQYANDHTSQLDPLALEKFSFHPADDSLANLLREAEEAMSLLTEKHVNHAPGSAAILLWTAFCNSTQQQVRTLIPVVGFHSKAMELIIALPARVRAYDSALMEAVLYSSIFPAIDAVQPVWSVPGIAPMVQRCVESFAEQWESNPWLQAQLKGYADVRSMLEELHTRIQQRQYTRSDYIDFVASQATINDNFRAVGQAVIGDLPNPDDTVARAKKTQRLVDWLAGRDVPGACHAAAELLNLVNNPSTTLALMEQSLERARSKYGKPLWENMASDCKQSLVDFIDHFAKRSQLFETLTQSKYRAEEVLEDRVWTQRIKRVLKNAHVTFRDLLTGSMEYQCFSLILEEDSLASVDLLQELDIICSFSAYVPFQGDIETVRLVEIALSVIQHFQRSHTTAVVHALERLELVKAGDPDLVYLKELGSNIPDEMHLSEFSDRFGKLHSLFHGLGAEHFQLLEEMASGGCSNILSFFSATDYHSEGGRKEFQTKVYHLNMRLHCDRFGNEVLTSLIDTHQMLSPFFARSSGCKIGYILQQVAATRVDMRNIETSNRHTSYILDMFKKAIAGTTETAIEQLRQLSERGMVQIDLRLMSCCPSSFCFTCAGDILKLREQDVKDFRSNLQYLRSLQGGHDNPDGSESREVCNIADEFSELLVVVDKLIEVLFHLEREGHPDYQNRSVCLPLKRNDLQEQKDVFQHKLHQWVMTLKESRQKTRLLHFFSNQDLATIMALLGLESINVGEFQSRSMRRTAVQKLANVPVARSCDAGDTTIAEETLVIAATLVDNYVRSISAIAPVQGDCDLQGVIRGLMLENHTNHSQLLQVLQTLFKTHLILVEPPLKDSENEQYICSSRSKTRSLSEALKLLCTVFLHRHKTLPCQAQVLFCSGHTTQTELEAFFMRVLSFPHLVFAMVGVECLGYTERSLLLEQQCKFRTEHVAHGTLYYICLDQDISTWWPQSYVTNLQLEVQPPSVLSECLQQLLDGSTPRPKVTVVVGQPGSGKTHFISKEQKKAPDQTSLTISLADVADTSAVIRKLAALPQKSTVFFNISSHVNQDDINRIFFQLLVCGTLADPEYSAFFALPLNSDWTWFVEIPSHRPQSDSHSGQMQTQSPGVHQPKDLAEERFPMVCLLAVFHTVTAENNKIEIGAKEREICAIMQAYNTGTLDPKPRRRVLRAEVYWSAPQAASLSEGHCHDLLHQLMDDMKLTGASKMRQVAFLRYLWVRLGLFSRDEFKAAVSYMYQNLAQKSLQHFLSEARYLVSRDLRCIWISCKQYFLISDPTGVSFKTFAPKEPIEQAISSTQLSLSDRTSAPLLNVTQAHEEENPNEFLVWAFGLPCETVVRLLDRKRFVLTKDFTYKLLLVHERKKARLPLIIEGETGVGKTFLLEMYTEFMNCEAAHSRAKINAPRLQSRLSRWIRKLMLKRLWTSLSSEARMWFSFSSDDNYPNQQRHASQGMEGLLTAEILSPAELTKLWHTLLTHLDIQTQEVAMRALAVKALKWLNKFQLLRPAPHVRELAAKSDVSVADSTELVARLVSCKTADLFFRKLIHPGVVKLELVEFMAEPIQLAVSSPDHEVVVFFDEVNTSSCLGVFKEMLMDHKLEGRPLAENIFFICAINPSMDRPFSENSVQMSSTAAPASNAFSQSSKVNAGLIDPYRSIYFVHELPPVMNELKWIYGGLSDVTELEEYIAAKIEMQKNLIVNTQPSNPGFSNNMKAIFARILLRAHLYCIKYLGESSVSQRDIQRVFLLVPYFWHVEEFLMKKCRRPSDLYDDLTTDTDMLKKSIFLAIAVVYFFRLPNQPVNMDGRPLHGVCRKDFQHFLHQPGSPSSGRQGSWDQCPQCTDPDFSGTYSFMPTIKTAVDEFVSWDHFTLPENVALTAALKENVFCTVACIQARIPLGIVGQPGSSKTLSFQIVRDNLRGEHSVNTFCKQFVAIDSFFYQCSEHSTSAQIAAVFDAATERQEFYNRQAERANETQRTRIRFENNKPVEETVTELRAQQATVSTHCVVFLDEAGLPVEEKGKMVLKVLHPYLDDRKVAFVALSNHWFDTANANRMVTLYRSQAELDDLITLALGCIKCGGKQAHERDANTNERLYITGLCTAFLELTGDPEFGRAFHHRDLIYLLRQHHRHLIHNGKTRINPNPWLLLSALEENFGGLKAESFQRLADIVFRSVSRELEGVVDFPSSIASDSRLICRSSVQILRDLKLESQGRTCIEVLRTGSPWAPRFRMIIDPTEDYTSVDILHQMELVDADSTHIFHMSNLPGDQDELHSAEVLVKIRRLLETACTIVLVNTGRIHGSLYELLNQTFSVIHTGGGEHTYANIAVGAATYPCRVHPLFQCIVVLKESNAKNAPTPFLSRFSKFLVRAEDAVQYAVKLVEPGHAQAVLKVEERCKAFIDHIGAYNFYGCQKEYSANCLLLSHLHPLANKAYRLVPFTSTTKEVREKFASTVTDEIQLAVRGLCSRLLQLVPTEQFVLGLKTLNHPAAYHTIYFDILEHFSLQRIIGTISKITSPSTILTESPAVTGVVGSNKFLLYTRSSLAVSRIADKPNEYFGADSADVLEIVDTKRFSKSSEAESFLDHFVESAQKRCAILLVDSSNGATSMTTVALIKHLVNQAAGKLSGENHHRDKTFVLLLHSPLYIPSSKRAYPCPFLQGWDCSFMDLPGGFNLPLINVKALAKSCALHSIADATQDDEGEEVSDRSGDLELLVSSLDRGLSAIKFELARAFCSRLTVSAPEHAVRTLQPKELIPIYVPNKPPAASGLKTTTVERAMAIVSVLDKYPEVLRLVGNRLFKQFGPQRSFDLLEKLAKHVAQRESFFSFADLVEMHMRPELENIFRKVMTALCRDFGLVSLLNCDLPGPIICSLLSLVPRVTSQEEHGYAHEGCFITYRQERIATPLFLQLKTQMQKIVKEVDMTQSSVLRDLHNGVESDECLSRLVDCDQLMDMYVSDLITDMCNWTGSRKSIEIARTYVDLTFKKLLESGSEDAPSGCDQLSLVHYTLRQEREEVTIILYGLHALEQLLGEDGIDEQVVALDHSNNRDEFWKKLAHTLFSTLWLHLSGLLGKLNTPQWSDSLNTWRQSYRVINEFFKPDHVVNLSDDEEGDDNDSGSGELYSALISVIRTESKTVRLMISSDIFFSSFKLTSSTTVVEAFLRTIQALSAERNPAPVAIVQQIVLDLTGKCEEQELLPLYLEYLKWLLSSLSACKETAVLSTLLHAINSSGDVPLPLPFQAASQLFEMLATKLSQLGRSRHQNVLLFVEQVVNKELLRDFPANEFAGAYKQDSYLPGLYMPVDFPEQFGSSQPDVMKRILNLQLSHIFFKFLCTQQVNRNMDLSALVSDANPLPRDLSARNVTPGSVLRLAARVRVAFEVAANEVTKLVTTESTVQERLDVLSLGRALEDLHSQHSPMVGAWMPFFVSKLLATSSAEPLSKFVRTFQGSWVQECLAKIDDTVTVQESLFTFLQSGSRVREEDTLDGAHASYEDFSTMFDRSVAADNDFSEINAWYSQCCLSSSKPVIPNMSSRGCAAMFIFLKVYHSYFKEDTIGRVKALSKTLSAGPLLTKCLQLFCVGCTVDVPELKTVFTPGKCTISELQYARDILVHFLAYVLGTEDSGDHYSTIVLNPVKLHMSYLFGAVNYRGPINPDPQGVRVDCCFQFEVDGQPTYVHPSRHPPVALAPIGQHLNALLIFSALCLHGVLNTDSAADTLEKVLTKQDIEAECGQAGGFLQQALTFCVNRIVQLHFLIYHDDTRLNPGSALGFVMASLERLIFLKSTGKTAIFKSIYSRDSWISGNQRQKAENYFQNEVVDQAHRLTCVRMQCSSADDVVSSFTALQQPQLTLQDVRGFLARCQSSETTSYPVLNGLLESLDHFQSLHLVIDISRFYYLLHRCLSFHLSNDTAMMSFSDVLARVPSKALRRRLSTFFKRAQKSFNEFHTKVGGTLQPGACRTRQPFYLLEEKSPLKYMLSTTAEDEDDILYRVMQEILRFQEKFLSVCQSAKEKVSNAQLCHALQAGQFEQSVPMLQVMSQSGAGMLRVPKVEMERLCLMHGQSNQEADKVWQNSFDLAAIEQCATHQFVNGAHQIDLARFRILFYFKEDQVNRSIMHVEPLSSDMPAAHFSEKLDDGSCDAIKQELKRQHYQDSLKMLQHLVIISTEIANLKASGESMASIRQEKMSDFIQRQQVQHQWVSLASLCSPTHIKLCHISDVHRLVTEHLTGHEYLYMRIPHMLKQEMSAELDGTVDGKLNAYFTVYMKGKSDLAIIDVADEAISILQDSVQGVQAQSDDSLVQVLVLLGLVGDDGDDVLCCLPDEVRGHHLKAVMAKLVKHGCTARGRQVEGLGDREKWMEKDEDSGQELPAWLFQARHSEDDWREFEIDVEFDDPSKREVIDDVPTSPPS